MQSRSLVYRFQFAEDTDMEEVEKTLFLSILAVGFLLVAFMFGLICKVMPRQRVLATDVWLGALLTALLFTGGKYIIGAYISRSCVAL